MAADGSVVIEIKGDAEDLMKAFRKINRSADNLKDELKGIQKALDLDPGSAELAARKQELLTDAVKETSRALDDLKDAQKKALELPATVENEAKYRALTREVEETSQELNRLQAELAETTRDMNRVGDAVDRAGREFNDMEGSANKAAGAFTVLKGAAAAVAAEAAMLAVDAFVDLGREALSAADSVTKFQKTLEFGGLDTATIEQAKDALTDYANSTTYDMQTVLDTGAQLGANGVKDFEKLTIAAGNLNAAASGNAETFDRVALALVQTVGAGKLTTENWNQIADAIPGASKVLQDEMLKNGAYTGEFRDAMAQGQITAEEFALAIMNLGLDDAAAEAARSTDTIAGAADNLQATIVEGLTGLLTNEGGYEGITGFINGIAATLETAGQYIGPAIDAISQSFTKVGEVFRETFTGSQQSAILGFLQRLATALVGLPFQVVALSASMLSAAWQALISIGGAVVNFFAGLPGAAAAVGAGFSALASTVSGALSGALHATIAWGSNMVSSARSAAQSVVSGVGSTLRGAVSQVATIGRQIVQGLANGIRNAASLVVSALKGVVQSAINAAKAKLGIASPSKVFKQFGEWTSEGYAIGVESGAKYVVNSIDGLADTLTRQMEDLNNEITALNEASAKKQAKTQEEIQREALEVQKNTLEKQIDNLEKFADEYADALGDVKDKAKDLSGDLSDFELFDNSEGDMHLWSLQPMIDSINAYGDAIMALKGRGVNESLLSEILEMDRTEATAFANELLAMTDEQYDGYMALWAEKENAAQRVSSAVYESEVEAINAEYTDKLPGLLGDAAEDAMGTFSDKLKEAGQGAISVARGIANGVIAELERINAAQRLQLAVAGASASFGAQIGAKANNAAEARIAYDSGMANRTAGVIAMSTATSASRDVVLNVNGKEFARATIDDYRSVEDQSPRIVSD